MKSQTKANLNETTDIDHDEWEFDPKEAIGAAPEYMKQFLEEVEKKGWSAVQKRLGKLGLRHKRSVVHTYHQNNKTNMEAIFNFIGTVQFH